MKRLTSSLVVAAAILAATPAFADPPMSDGASAQLFFERGRDAASRGDAVEACKNFEESLRLDLAVGTLFNLARCEEDLGSLASAWQHLREGIDRLEEKDLRRKQALAAAGALERRLPKLEVELARGAKGHVFRDGLELATPSLGTALPLNPGRHVVVVRSDGRAEAFYDVELREGERRTLVVAPGPALVVALGPAGTSASSGSGRGGSPGLRTAGWITAGLGAASLGVGLVTGGLAFERSTVVHAHCDDTNQCDKAGLSALASSKDLGGIATMTLAAGATVLAMGIVLLILEGKGSGPTAHTPSTMLRF